MKILDATAGCRGIWYQKNHPYVTFMDKRNGLYDSKTENVKFKQRRRFKIKPNVVADWTKTIPFDNDTFDMVIFDPPFTTGTIGCKKNNFVTQYEVLNKTTWESDLRFGISELFRVLKPDGFFIFKWAELSIKIDKVLKLFPYRPLYGSQMGTRNHLYWIVFIKNRPEKPLLEG